MFEIQQIRELKARKALLISECALDRSLITAEVAVFEQKTKWPALLFSGAMTILPRLQFLLPVAGWVVARGISRFGRGSAAPGKSSASSAYSSPTRGSNLVGIVRKGMVAWQLFKKGHHIWSQWRERRALSRLKPIN